MLRSMRTPGRRQLSEKNARKIDGPTMTKQSFRDECDINVLVKRFAKTGVISQRTAIPLRGDFTDALDFRGMQDALNAARESFMSLSSDVRERFGHNPEKFVRWTLDKENLPELRKLGLAKPEPEVPKKPEPMEVRVVGETVIGGDKGAAGGK